MINLPSLAYTISLTLISTVGVFAAFNVGNRAEAIVVAGDPANYVVGLGAGYDGVVSLEINRTDFYGTCTGSILPTSLHILTAAHCFTQDITTAGAIPGNFVTQSATAFFDLPTGRTGLNASEFYVHPNWSGDL